MDIDKAFEKWQEWVDEFESSQYLSASGRAVSENSYTAGYKQLANEINIILEEEPKVYDFIGRVIPKIKEILK